MLPIVLVLLVATSALAAPSVQLTQNSINDVAPPRSNGRLIGGHLTERAFEYMVDEGDTNVYMITVRQIVNDLANQPDRASQAVAIGQALALLIQLATGIPGDACAAANAINSYAGALRAGNPGGARREIANYVQSLASGIDLVVQLSNNPGAARYAVGPRGNCGGGGRTYQFEAAWEGILSSVSPNSAGLLNEQYCAAKRLYSAFNSRSNNVGAAITAVSLPPVNRIFQEALEQVARFLAAIGTGNAGGAAGSAKQALFRAANAY